MGALQSAESVARAAVDGIVRRRFHIATDTISLYAGLVFDILIILLLHGRYIGLRDHAWSTGCQL